MLPFLVAVAFMAALMAFPMAGVPVVAAPDSGIVCQSAGQIGLHSLVRAAGNAAVKLDARVLQGGISPAAYAAADHRVHPVSRQEANQGAMPRPPVSTTWLAFTLPPSAS